MTMATISNDHKIESNQWKLSFDEKVVAPQGNSSWIDPRLFDSRTVDGRPAFVAGSKAQFEKKEMGSAKSQARNPSYNGFVYGNGSLGEGFYSWETLDAFMIYEQKLLKKRDICRRIYEHYETDRWIFRALGRTLNEKQRSEKAIVQRNAIQADEMLSYVRARLAASGPKVPLSSELVREFGVKRLSEYDHAGYSMKDDTSDYVYPVELVRDVAAWL